MLLFCCCFS